jgi:hypothetical protein
MTEQEDHGKMSFGRGNNADNNVAFCYMNYNFIRLFLVLRITPGYFFCKSPTAWRFELTTKPMFSATLLAFSATELQQNDTKLLELIDFIF